MTRFEYRKIHTDPISVTTSGDIFHVSASVHFVTGGFAFDEANGVNGNAYLLDGTFQSGMTLRANGVGTAVVIGERALISGRSGVSVVGAQSQVSNGGTITVSGDALLAYGEDAALSNNGYIGGYTGLYIAGANTVATNTRHGEIVASQYGFYVAADSGEYTRLINHGRIVAGQFAAYGGESNDSLRNDGRVVGDISLGNGFNAIDLRGGRLDGQIFGGADSDYLTTDTARYKLIEEADHGYDFVHSSASYTLNDNVEGLVLDGTRNIFGQGNDLGNDLYDNPGNNILRGYGGNDNLYSNSGDDSLFGGAGNDVFIFVKGHGKDVIEDFVQGEDMIVSSQWLPNVSFEDILEHTRNVDSGALVEFGHHSIRFVGVQKEELTAADFNL